MTAPIQYRVTYSVGTNAHDEQRFVVKVAADQLARKIIVLQSRPNHSIYSVERAY